MAHRRVRRPHLWGGMISNNSMKRTTLILDERRLGELKRVAAERGQTLSRVVDEFLAEGLRRSRAPKKKTTTLPVFRMGEPRVDLADRHRLWETMERECDS
jgi:hypothetical protein